ncbi:hypothetical protein V8E52_005820 [Russula decolorans]
MTPWICKVIYLPPHLAPEWSTLALWRLVPGSGPGIGMIHVLYITLPIGCCWLIASDGSWMNGWGCGNGSRFGSFW